jgi:hypothetical protein
VSKKAAAKAVPEWALFKYWDNRLNHRDDQQGNKKNDKAVPKKAAATSAAPCSKEPASSIC